MKKKVNWKSLVFFFVGVLNPFFIAQWWFGLLFIPLIQKNSTQSPSISLYLYYLNGNKQIYIKHISLRTYNSLYRLYNIKIRLKLSFLYQFSRENTQFSFILMWELFFNVSRVGPSRLSGIHKIFINTLLYNFEHRLMLIFKPYGLPMIRQCVIT